MEQSQSSIVINESPSSTIQHRITIALYDNGIASFASKLLI